MDPTAAEIEGFTSLDLVADWAALGGPASSEDSPRSTFYAHLGLDGTAPLRLIANISAEDFEELAAAWRPGDHPPTAAQLSAAKLVGRACRIALGMQRTLAQERARQEALELAALRPPASSTPPAPAAGRVVRLNHIVNQVSDETRPMLHADALEDAFKNYVTVMGAMPSAEDECTAEQLTAVKALLDEDAVPYCDFALWGPFGNRLRRKMIFDGHDLQAGRHLGQARAAGASRLRDLAAFLPAAQDCVAELPVSFAGPLGRLQGRS